MGLPIIGDLIDGVKDIVSEVIVDKDKKIQIEAELEFLRDRAGERLHQEMMGQMSINRTEAASRSIFVAGWRPFIGWVCGAAVSWSFVIGPLVEWISRLFGWQGSMPELDVGQLMTLVLAMLGVGAMRSYDKGKGTSNDYLRGSPPPPINLLPEKPKKKFLGITLPENAPWA